MIGVNDNCKVYGINCTRKQEDIARCQIDNTIKQFQPHVLPHLYLIDFIPVKLMASDNLTDSIDPLLKVLEVSVNRPNVTNSLYQNDRGEIYVRRDGSIEGPLKATQIVEWCRVNFTSNHVNFSGDNYDNFDSKNAITSEDVILAKESYSNNLNLMKLEELEETINENHRRIEVKLQEMQEAYEKKEREMETELLKSKEVLTNTKFEMQSLRKRSKYSFVCRIL